MGELSGYSSLMVNSLQPNLRPMIPTGIPLTPTPEQLTVWRASTPWQTVRSMLGLVIICFFIAQLAVLVVAGYIDGDMNGTLGPFDPFVTFVGSLCLSPFLMVFFFLRRPKLTHSINAHPNPIGQTTHALAGGAVIQSTQPTSVRHHIFRSTAPLEMPRPKHLWLLFILGVTVSTACLLPLTLNGANVVTVLLAVVIVLPAWLIGFATPVFAWWSITSRHMGITMSRRDAEWILVAGMLSTVPAIIINSLVSPVVLNGLGFDAYEVGSWGEGMILFLSAPIGEELSKAFAVLCLSHLIVSPKHGFYVGSTVGLGFALLENAQYIFMALLSDYSSISYFFTASLRGLSSIPGHALWTGLSGYAIGCWLARDNRLANITNSAFVTHDPEATWILYDKKGQPVSTAGWANIPSDRMIRLVSRYEQYAWSMPSRPLAGILLAILGHGLWNGTSWGVGRLLADSDSILAILLQLGWLVLMVLTLWFCILRWLPTVVLGSKEA